MDPSDHGSDDERANPTGGPLPDWDAQFTAIVSGLSGEIKWSTNPAELDDEASRKQREFPRAPDSVWSPQPTDTAEARRIRREMRRAQRAADFAAFQQAQDELASAHAADTEHFVPPPPPPLPKWQRRTVGASLLIILGTLLVIFPMLLPAPFELIAVIGVAMVFTGGGVLIAGMRRHRDETDPGAEV